MRHADCSAMLTHVELTGFREEGVRDHSALCGSHMLYLKINVTDVLLSSINCKSNK